MLCLVAGGATNRAIGSRLYISPKTASVHVSRILTKLDATTRTEAAALAHASGLVQPWGRDESPSMRASSKRSDPWGPVGTRAWTVRPSGTRWA